MGDFLRVTGENVVKGAGRIIIAPTSETHPTQLADVLVLADGATQYDLAGTWEDLGATFNGIIITRGFDTEGYTVDQVQGDLGEDLTGWTNTVETQLAETTLANFQKAWEGSAITSDTSMTTNDEDTIHFGDPSTITQWKLGVLFMDRAGLIRGYFFRLVQRAGDDSSITHEKGGDPMSIPVLFNAFPDTTVTNRDERIFSVIQQLSTTTP